MINDPSDAIVMLYVGEIMIQREDRHASRLTINRGAIIAELEFVNMTATNQYSVIRSKFLSMWEGVHREILN